MKAHRLCVSLNYRLESNKGGKEEVDLAYDLLGLLVDLTGLLDLVPGLGIRFWRAEREVSGLGFGVWGFGFWVSGVRFRVSGFGFRV